MSYLGDPNMDETIQNFRTGFVDQPDEKIRQENVAIFYFINSDGKQDWSWEPATSPCEHVGPCSCPVNVQIWNDMSQRNRDIPDELHAWEQGWGYRTNEHLDPIKDDSGKRVRWVNKLNDRHFRELCKPYGGQLHFIHMMLPADIVSKYRPQVHRHEWLAKELGCKVDIAAKLIEGFKSFELDRKSVMKLLKQNLMNFKGDNKKLAEIADALEDLALQVAEPEWSKIDNHFSTYEDDVMFEDNVIYLVDEVLEGLKFDQYREDENSRYEVWNEGLMTYEEVESDQVWDDELDTSLSNGNVFSSNPLYYGAEALPDEFIRMIQFADDEKLDYIIKNIPNKRKSYKKWGFLTPSQTSQAWIYIKERKAELAKADLENPSKDLVVALNWVKKLGKGKSASSIIFKFAEGTNYNFFGIPINFSRPASKTELSVLWTTYKAL